MFSHRPSSVVVLISHHDMVIKSFFLLLKIMNDRRPAPHQKPSTITPGKVLPNTSPHPTTPSLLSFQSYSTHQFYSILIQNEVQTRRSGSVLPVRKNVPRTISIHARPQTNSRLRRPCTPRNAHGNRQNRMPPQSHHQLSVC